MRSKWLKALTGNKILFGVFCVIFSSSAMASSGITFNGKILRTDKTPVDGQFVGFKISVMDGNTGACEMYQETHTYDMRTTNGGFALVIGTGTPVGTFNVAGVTVFDELFLNSKTYSFSTGACTGTPYVAGAKDGRKLFVQFRETGASPWEDLPLMNIAYVPFAYSSLVSNKVGLHDSSSLLRVENAGTPGAATALTSANMTELMALLGGTTTQYIKSIAGTAGEIGASNTSGAVTLSLPNTAVTAGTYGSATQVPVFTVDAKGRITGVTNTNITGGGGGITDLTGDVTATGTGSVAATIANNAVTTVKINNGAVTDAKLASDAVTTVKILDANVTLNKLAGDSVNSSKIVDGSITGSDISGTAALSVASVAATGNVGAGTMSTRSLGFFELPGNGTSSVTLQAPASLAGDTVYTLPAAAPGSNMILQSDSSGVLSWVADATGGSPGDASYAGKGVVQFDTDAATSGITVASGVAKIATGGVATGMIANDAVSFAKIQNIATNKLLGRATALSGDIEEITLGTGLSFTGTTLNATATDSFAALPCGDGYLPYKSSGSWTCKQVASANTNDAIITRDSSGNFVAGTGQFSTSVKITDGAAGGQVTIAAPAAFTSYNLTLPTDDGGANQVLQTNGSGVLSWVTALVSGATGLFGDGSAASPSVAFTNSTGTGLFRAAADQMGISTAGAERVRIDASGNVGIGTTNPGSKLDVKGNFAISGATSGAVKFAVPAVAGSATYTFPAAAPVSNKILQSDSSGNLTWVDDATGAGGEINTASNVGVGGVGIYKSKTGVNLDLKNINAGSSKITVTNDAANSELDIDIDEANLTLGNLGGSVPLAKGGTSANLTAISGGVVYSGATSMAITAAGTNGQILRSNGAGAPLWTTATYPTTTSSGQLLYSSAANTVSGLATALNGVLVTSGTGAPSISSTIPSATQDNITRTGTITSGVWNGTTIGAGNGGTGQSSYAVGDLLYASGATALSKLNAGTSGYVLTSNGAGTAPSWQAAAGGATLNAITAATGTATLDHGANAIAWNWNSLTTGVGLTLGSSSMTSGSILNVTDSYNNVGSTGPAAKFTVSGASSAAIPLMLTNAGTGLSFRVNDDGTDTDSTPVIVDASGNVGIGTTSARATLDVIGTIAGKPSTINGTSTVDFSTGNIQHTTGNCGAFQFNNLKDGATYTFVVKGTTSATCSFTAYSGSGTGSLTVHLPPGHGATTVSKHTLYSLLVSGSDVYVAWVPGY